MRFVATDGANTNEGTLQSPFASIQKALEKASAGDTIFIRGGEYYQYTDLSGVKGDANNPIRITAYANESVVITGAEAINTIGGSVWTRLNSSSSIFKTTVNKPVWQLWVDGKMAIVARWPDVTVGHPMDPIRLKADNTTPVDNSWWDQDGTWGKMTTSWLQTGHDDVTGKGHVINDESKQTLSGTSLNFTGGSIILNYHSETQFSRPITQHETGSSTIYHDAVLNPHDKGSGYFLVEAKGALDRPGEWYYDKDTKEVWLWPFNNKNPNDSIITAKTQSYALDIPAVNTLLLKG